MNHSVKKILSAVFIGSILMSSTAITANAAQERLILPKTPILLASTLPYKVLEAIQVMQAPSHPVLEKWNLDTGHRGTDETPAFTMEPGQGTDLYWECEVPENSEPVHVYLYDIGKGGIVSAMSPKMQPGEKRQAVFHVGSDSQLCIKIESATGGTAYAAVSANQITNTSTLDK